MSEGIYLLHTREFINSKQPIYKIGRSSNMNTRLSQYPKGSNILCSIKCENSNLCENELIKLFTKLFTIRKDYGNEYFEGDYNNMLFIIITYLYQDKLNKINFIINDDNNNNTNNDDTNNDDTNNNNNNNKISNKNIDYNKFEKNMFDLEKKEKEEKIDGYINDRTCPKCLKQYRYPSILKQHFENTYHCKQSPEYIKEFFTINKNEKKYSNDTIYKCTKCQIQFINNKALNRHSKETKCGKLQKLESYYNNNNLINTLSIKQLKNINFI